MTRYQKEIFIEQLCDSIRDRSQKAVEFMPEAWDGIELRQYLADQFTNAVLKGTMTPARKRAYNNEITINNKI